MTKFTVRTPILRILRSARAMVLAAAFASIVPQQAYAQRQTPPPVPDPIQVPAGQRLFLAGHAYGTSELYLPALRLRGCLDIIWTAGHLVQ